MKFFEGRMNRTKFICFFLIAALVYACLGLKTSQTPASLTIGIFALLGCLVFTLSICARRLHDLDITGWYSLLFLVPIGNILLLAYLSFAAGTSGENAYGPPPV